MLSAIPVSGLMQSILVSRRGSPVRPVEAAYALAMKPGSAGSAKLCQAMMQPDWPASSQAGKPRTGISDSIETRSEEHTSELQSLMRISYAVFCLKKKNKDILNSITTTNHQQLVDILPYTFHTLIHNTHHD